MEGWLAEAWEYLEMAGVREGTYRDKYSEILRGERPSVRDLMNKHFFPPPCSAAITDHEQVAEVIDALKLILELLGQSANWFSTDMMVMIDHWAYFAAFPLTFCTI